MRRMPSSRTHNFQLRSTRFATTPPTWVTVNGKPLPKVARSTGEAPGWFIEGKQASPNLLVSAGALVIRTSSIELKQAIEVEIK